jgi:deoxyadenosine/deoxycytidine kinase
MTTRRHPYVAIEGVIGVGKTTLVRLLSTEFDATPLLEVFEENPFLSDFYTDRERYAFQTQIFFLLSRYRQQHQAIPDALARGALLSDYTFAKDGLFAHLNLNGDELTVYEKLHGALAEKIPTPDLVVYLRADLDVLMARIASRDRPYERGIDRGYIESLRLAYEGFFAAYTQAPVLMIDTNHLNFVQDPQALASIRDRIRAALGQGAYQQASLEFAPRSPAPAMSEAERGALGTAALAVGSRRLSDLQQWQHASDAAHGKPADMMRDFLELTQTVGAISAALAEGSAPQEGLRLTLAACLGRLLQLANTAGVDLEEAYVAQELIR